MGLTLIPRIAVSICLSMTVALALSLSKPNCSDTCGNVTIPYPFGIGAGCSASSWFTVACQNSTFKATLSSINMEIESVSLDDGTVRVIQPVSTLNCSDELRPLSLGRSLIGSAFTISAFQNSLALLGCDKSIWLHAANNETLRGCVAVCGGPNSNDTSCNGVNCCQIPIPKGFQELQYSYNRTLGSSTNGYSCGYAFLTERKWFQEDYKTYRGLHGDLSNPFDEGFRSANVVLEWEVDNMTISNYTSCRYINTTRSTPLCSCNPGFEGNPYLPGGCQDVNECQLNYCSGICINTLGSYRCHGEPPTKKLASIGIVSAVGSLLLLIAAMCCYRVIRKRLKANRKKRFFTRNGGMLLEKRLHSTDNGVEKTKLFNAKELAQATDQYNENRVLGRGGQGTVYKGMLKDGRVVAVKKSKKVDKDDIELFINEVVVLSQINHRHVVKLLGCCLETEVPLLVYEFIPMAHFLNIYMIQMKNSR